MLTNKAISDEEYQKVQNIWEKLRMRTLRDLHNAYVTADVCILADVFEKFRTTCQSHYGLDPLNFYGSPGLAYQACLKMSGVELELLTDADMQLFFERAIRGGLSMASLRYAKANNRYMGEKFDKSL